MAGFKFSVTKSGSLSTQAGKKKLKDDPRARILRALRRASLMIERAVKKGIQGGQPGGVPFRPLAASTILLRKSHSDRPLLDTGALLGAVSSSVDPVGLSAFIGVHRMSGNVNLAMIHEYGTKPYAITVTPRMRRFFKNLAVLSGGRIRQLRNDTDTIYHPGIPARPFFGPVIEAIRPKIKEEFRLAVERK